MDTITTVVRAGPWNKGKLVGQKAPLKVTTSGPSASGSKYKCGRGVLRCSTSASIASFAAVTS